MNRQWLIAWGLAFTLAVFFHACTCRAEQPAATSALRSLHLPVFDVSRYASLNAAILAIGSGSAVLVVSNEETVQENLAIPGRVHLRFGDGGSLNIKLGATLTINGQPDAGLQQIFRGLGRVNFGAGLVKVVYPEWWGAQSDGKTDNTRAFQQAINAMATAGGGDVSLQRGTYLVTAMMLDSNVNIRGQGWDSIIKQNKAGSQFCLSINPYTGGTPNPKENKHDIRISNVQFRGTVDVDGFSEGTHLVNINAASNVVISKCKFVGWRGDAVYLGSGNVARTERHNVNIAITDCVFDGMNNDNRNAISVIDGEAITISGCRFVSCTRKNMPGAIDVEPDIENTFAVVRNIVITRNTFENIGGFGGAIGVVFLLGQTAYTVPPENIVISNNTIDFRGSASRTDGIFLYQAQRVNDSTPRNKITVSGNTVRNTRRPFKISGMKGIVLKDNVFEVSTYAGVVSGAPGISERSKEKCQQIDFIGNRFSLLGSVDDVGIAVLNDVDHLQFVGNTFQDIGMPVGTAGRGISFEAGTADWVRIENNRFSGPRTGVAVAVGRSARTDPAHNTVLNNSADDGQEIFLPVARSN